MAQIARAILFARVMATTSFGLRAIRRSSHEPFGTPKRVAAVITDMAPQIRRLRMSDCPFFETLPSLLLPPVECCLGTSPSQAEKSRPLLKQDISGAKASIAIAV